MDVSLTEGSVPDENKALVRRFFEEGVNARNQTIMAESFDVAFVNHAPITPPPHIRRFLPDLVYVVEDLVAEGDKVAVRLTGHGTDTGHYLDHTPTGQPVVFEGIAIVRIRNRKIVERWANVDVLALAHAIGVPASYLYE